MHPVEERRGNGGLPCRAAELFTLTGAEYEALHGAWLKALRVLPDYTIVHKQDYFTEEHYRPDLASDESFLGRAFERHFNERPFLRHSCYLFITKTSKEQMRRRSDFSSLCRGFIVPQEIRDTESVTLFLDAAEQMRRILCDAGFIRLEPLTADEIVGTADDSGLIARYFALGTEGIVTNEDLRLDDGQIRIGNRSLAMYTLSDLDYVPQAVGTDSRYERFSTDRSDCRLSFAAPAGLLLGHPHIYNQYVFLDNHAETLKSLEARARNMNSLARYSRANSVNKEWIDLYLNEAHTEGYRSVRCHCNVLIWADSETALKGICNDVGSQLALMAARLTAIRSMCRRSSGPAYRVPRESFPLRSRFRHSSNRPSASSLKRRPTVLRRRPSASNSSIV